MLSYFKDIGFIIKDKKEFDRFILYCLKNGDSKLTNNGRYIIFPIKNRIQVWFFARNNQLKQIIPFYEGKSNIKAKIEEIYTKKEEIPQISCGVYDKKHSSIKNSHFIFETPNYFLIKNKIKKNKEYFFNLTAFTEKAEIFDNEEQYNKDSEKNKEIRKTTKNNKDKSREIKGFALPHFIPTGMFNLINKKGVNSSCSFAGKIKEVNLIKNTLTNVEFYHMIVETTFGEIDVVCLKEDLQNKPKVGKVLDGYFYLIGKPKVKYGRFWLWVKYFGAIIFALLALATITYIRRGVIFYLPDIILGLIIIVFGWFYITRLLPRIEEYEKYRKKKRIASSS